VGWPKAWRLIASRYPPIDLFERLTEDRAVWEALILLETATNPRIRDEAGDISLVPPGERVSGPGASWVMAPFTHVNPKGSRFTDGTYGAYYAADGLPTAIAEVAYHFGRFAADSADPPRSEDYRVLLGAFDGRLAAVAALPPADAAAILDPADYRAARAFAANVRARGEGGIVYPSVRHAGGMCIAVFRPSLVPIPRQERHVQLHWDGRRVTRWFDYAGEVWHAVDPPSRGGAP